MSRESLPHSFALREEIDAALLEERSYNQWSPELQKAHCKQKCGRVYQYLRLQLVVGLGISTATLIFDLLLMPQLLAFSIGWRLTTIVPLTIAGLFLFKEHQIQTIKLLAAISLTAYGVHAILMASVGGPELMVRYSMGATLLLGFAMLALPYSPDELKRFGLAFGLATSLANFWPNPLPADQTTLHLSLMALVGIPAWWIARAHWELDLRAYLLDLRNDITRVELEENNKLLRQLSEQDPLTGIPNRRHFERVCSENLKNHDLRATGKIAFLMIDLDHFKAFNDRHGHQAGDRCLSMVGVQLQQVFGKRRGIVARYGGEEFVAAIQERFEGEANALAEDFRSAIARMLVPIRDEAKPLITTSIGMALVPSDTRLSFDDLIEMADVALYSAKRAGRNRVEIIETGAVMTHLSGIDDHRRRA